MSLFLSCQANYRQRGVILLNNIAMGDWIKIINMAFNTRFHFKQNSKIPILGLSPASNCIGLHYNYYFP